MNNFVLHKILPKLTFDGSKKVIVNNNEKEKKELLSNFMNDLKNYIDVNLSLNKNNNAIMELEHIIKNADSNNDIVNYWA